MDGEHFHAEATQLLDLLELWIREQAITDVLSRKLAANLLEELRNDRRFWAQQRRQFTRVWTSIVDGLRQETRPLSAVLGESTSSRLLDAFEEMDTEHEMVDAVVAVLNSVIDLIVRGRSSKWPRQTYVMHRCGPQ